MTDGSQRSFESRCSDLGSALPLIGTAPMTSRWWLIEHPGPWGSHAVRDASTSWIAACAQVPTDRARVVLVRRHAGFHDRHTSAGHRIFTFAPGDHVVWGRFVDDGEDPRIDDFGEVPAAPAWEPVFDYPRVTVCTNGRRDRCCAERGRAALDSLPPDVLEHVWECTHLGGHRFAPVALAIPSGVVLGRVTPHSLIDMVRHNHLDLDTLRGRSDLTPPEQVGELSARRAWGRTSIGEHLRVSSTQVTDGSDVTVVVTGPDGPDGSDDSEHSVTVRRRMSAPAITSCAATPEALALWEEVH